MTQAPGYRQEDKWTFLTEGKALGVPVSPFIDDVPAVVLKHKSIEVTTTTTRPPSPGHSLRLSPPAFSTY